MSDAGDEKAITERRTGSRRSNAETTRLAVALVVGGVIAVFALLNTDKVKVDWVIGSGQTPLIVVIVICLLIGGLVGHVSARRGARARRKRGDD